MSRGRRRWRPAAALATAVLLGAPALARAQGFVDATIGASSGGLVTTTATTYGGSLGYFGHLFGVEGSYGYSAHAGTASSSPPGLMVTHLNIRTISVDLLIGPQMGGKWRPFGAVGVGLVGAVARSKDVYHLSGENGQNDIAIDFGGGFIGWVTPRIGARIDVRYFKDVRAEHELTGVDSHFIRFGAGLALRF